MNIRQLYVYLPQDLRRIIELSITKLMDRRDFIKKATMAAAGAVVASPVSAMLREVAGGKTLRVLLINGSPRTDGNTFCCLKEIEATLQKHGVESEIVQIGAGPVNMCVNCGGCRRNGGKGCVRRVIWCRTSLQRRWLSVVVAVLRPRSRP